MFSSMKKMLNLVSIAAVTLGIGTNMAHAAEDFAFGGLSKSCYTQPAVTMTPQDDTVQNDLVHMTHERVYHTDGSTGTILLFGQVQPWIQQYGDAVSFSATFKDPDGRGTDAQVRAELRFVGPQGISILATLNSNDSARVTNETQTMRTSLNWNLLNRTDGYYLVRVTVTRSKATLTPAVFGYNLCSLIG